MCPVQCVTYVSGRSIFHRDLTGTVPAPIRRPEPASSKFQFCETANPVQATRAATVDAAQLMGWQDRVGSIEPPLTKFFEIQQRSVSSLPC
jgi:hypothetical protein